jgi:hypothetical protein
MGQHQTLLASSSHQGGSTGLSFFSSGQRGLPGQGSLSLEQNLSFKALAGLGLGVNQQKQLDEIRFAGQSASLTLMGVSGKSGGIEMVNGGGMKNWSPGFNPLLAGGGSEGLGSSSFAAMPNGVGLGEPIGHSPSGLGMNAGLSMSRQGSRRAGTLPGLDLSSPLMSGKVRN